MEITGDPYRSSGNKNTQISHPALHYIHLLFSMTVHLKGEVTHVAYVDLSYIWALTKGSSSHLSWVSIFVDMCLVNQKKKKGKISFGGMITLLALDLGIKFPSTCARIKSKVGVYFLRLHCKI